MPRIKCSKRHLHLAHAREMKKMKGDVVIDASSQASQPQPRSRPRSMPVAGPSTSMDTLREDSNDCDSGDSTIDSVDWQSQDICNDASFTRSEKKIIIFGADSTDDGDDTDDSGSSLGLRDGRFVVDAIQMDSLVRAFPCRECFESGTLSASLKERWGLAAHLLVTCSACGESFDWWSSECEKKPTKGKGRERRIVNKAATFASLSSGMGATSFNGFCESMDLPGMHPETFQNCAETIYGSTEEIRNLVFSRAAETVRREHAKLKSCEDTTETVLDIAVSYDGTWLTRGHTSKVGIGCVVDILTGLVLDAHVMSTYCQTCDSKTDLKESQPEAYAEWEQEHLGSGACSRNFHGTSGMMEIHAMKVLWLRSLQKHNVRYVTVVSDGDAKAYKALSELQPYGPDCPVQKEECINHVCKGMGTALRNLVSDPSKQKTTLGGKGHGRLTQKTISRLTTYYTRAVRNNKTAAEMKCGVMAALYHGFSTDDKPQHHFCPPGKDSWCFFNSALALRKDPGPHATLVHTPLDQSLLEAHLLPVYERLTDKALLKRCERKATQNSNESLHNSIWSKCPKHKFYTRSRVELAAALGISEFNSGPLLLRDIKKVIGCGTSDNAVRLGNARVNKRAAVSRKEARDRATSRRQKVREAVRRRQEELAAEEGGPAYAPGMF